MPYAGPPVTGQYLELLAAIHRHSRPRTYLEIGMRTGESIAQACPETIVVGIDPCPAIDTKVNADARLFFETSDDFFAHHDVREVCDGNPLDLAFIDGMHLFEYALRDFRNVERNATPDSVVLVHDCLPREAPMATRERQTAMWTGDTWKLVCCLREMRPDLDVATITVKASGLAIIRNLDPASTVLFDRYDEALERFLPLEFDHIDGRQQDALNLIPNDLATIQAMVGTWPPLAGRSPQPKKLPRSWPVVRFRTWRSLKLAARRAQHGVERVLARGRRENASSGRPA
ncbi:MAG: class I SAM-dependent methyltransferase [Acidimicrobiia bacterium]